MPAVTSVTSTDLFYDVQVPGVGGAKATGQQIYNFASTTLLNTANTWIATQTFGNAIVTNTLTPKRLTGNTSSVPTANSCTGFSLATGSADFAGRVSFNAATSCSITFGSVFTNPPFCTAVTVTTPTTVQVVTSTTGFALTFGANSTGANYICAGS